MIDIIEGKLYKVKWHDITNFTHENIKEPYLEYASLCWTIGYLKQDEDTLLVINGGNYEDDEKCGDAIPIGCVKEIICLEE